MKKAVALKYPQGAPAPFITAKGTGTVAELIVSEAEKCNVKVEENRTMVDLLSVQDVGEAIPEEAYEAMAVIFSCILEK